MLRDAKPFIASLMLVLVVASGCISIDYQLPQGQPVQREASPSSSSASRSVTAHAKPTPTTPASVVDSPTTANVTEAVLELPRPPGRPHVVVATFDTGVNPFHPAWRSNDSLPIWLPGYPFDAIQVNLTLGIDQAADVAASAEALALIRGGPSLYAFPGTRVIGAKAEADDDSPVFDPAGVENSHGARAISQIGGSGYAVGNHTYVVSFDDVGGEVTYEPFIAKHMEWVIQQPWIDIIHVNMAFPAPYPVNSEFMRTFVAATEAGKIVVLPAGNGLGNTGLTPAYPQETQHTTVAPGTLVAGANDQCSAGTFWSNYDPHVVMDGSGTVAAATDSYGDDSFSGTSSASPRTAGYVAELLYQLRVALNYTGGTGNGALIDLAEGNPRPENGPLADGRLTPAELHEVVRKTARPDHDSRLDGEPFFAPCPSTPNGQGLTYVKNGYGEVSEHTLPAALDVLLGLAPMPERPTEDRFYEASETYRETRYGLPV